jgi:hypothetical protein
MKERELLNIILEDADGFRQVSLQETLVAVRSRRRARIAGRAVALGCVLTLLGLWWSAPKRETASFTGAQRKAAEDPPVQIVRTHRLSPGIAVASCTGTHTAVFSRMEGVAWIETRNAPAEFDRLGDDELLAIAPGELKLIVWHAPHEAELVLVEESRQ